MSLSLQPGCKSLECATIMSGTVESWKNYGLAKKNIDSNWSPGTSPKIPQIFVQEILSLFSMKYKTFPKDRILEILCRTSLQPLLRWYITQRYRWYITNRYKRYIYPAIIKEKALASITCSRGSANSFFFFRSLRASEILNLGILNPIEVGFRHEHQRL